MTFVHKIHSAPTPGGDGHRSVTTVLKYNIVTSNAIVHRSLTRDLKRNLLYEQLFGEGFTLFLFG